MFQCVALLFWGVFSDMKVTHLCVLVGVSSVTLLLPASDWLVVCMNINKMILQARPAQ